MNDKIIWILLAIATQSCSQNNNCLTETKKWKEDAVKELNYFKLVDKEIKSFRVLTQGEQIGMGLLIQPEDSYKLENKYNISLPKLKYWFQSTSDRGGIIYNKDGTIKVYYEHCFCNDSIFDAYLFYSQTSITPSSTKNLIPETTDTLSMGENWYFIITRGRLFLD